VIDVSIAADLGTEHRRREPRVPIEAEVGLRELGHEAVDAKLINLSSRGFMAETIALISPGARVWLTLPGLPRTNALVVWARNGRVGGEFAPRSTHSPCSTRSAPARAEPATSLRAQRSNPVTPRRHVAALFAMTNRLRKPSPPPVRASRWAGSRSPSP
jgi:hypothetical protein